MRKICLTLPTNRLCASALVGMAEEATYAVEHFDVEVHLLVLDSCDVPTVREHAAVLDSLPKNPRIVVHHLPETEQRDFLRRVIARSRALKADQLLDLMLPNALSYGACTNRAFLIGSALGCESIHRRDSDSRYQVVGGQQVFPIHHELTSLGKRVVDAACNVSDSTLTAAHSNKTVAMVGSSFVGELSVDIGEIEKIDQRVYYDIVSLWAPGHWPEDRKRQLVDESFRGAGTDSFTHDHSVLTVVDPMRVDMCNISFHGVHERIPLPPATDTIGSDYFLIHLIHDAALPGVLHNRNIVNFYTGERRTDPGFMAYQMRFVKFLLSMLYFNFIYQRMAETDEALFDNRGHVRSSAIADLVRESTRLDRTENIWRLTSLDTSYRKLGGRYSTLADLLITRRQRLLDEAQHDMEDFALLIETWAALVQSAHNTPAPTHRFPEQQEWNEFR
ncbi:DUF6271 family protein [Streptomyces sp. MB09-02B]|uniref:DUF6271 family protein n=1 Tax=Streptomyces sp. MB09-02B TaxID=3028667 RepID=UPI0029A45AEB|nr:DUF6271 family protein [Streptomyces sp. MB09-02B]MDX3638435.1 DUF6271 family protein [Streptomyces sp. MB09-02B]